MEASRSEEFINVVIVAFDDYTDIDLILLWDLLNRVHLKNWRVRILGDSALQRSMTGLTVPTHGDVAEANSADAVLFTSGKGTRAKIIDPQYLAKFALDPTRQLVGSICSGALLLAALGLLRGKRATTYPSAVGLLQSYGVEVIEEPIVIEGNIATAGGCLAAKDLAAWVIARLVGKGISDAVVTSCLPVGRGLSFQTEVEVIPEVST